MNTALDYVIVALPDSDYEIWTPDQTGAIIGLGETREAAVANAIEVLTATIKELKVI